MTQAAEEKQRVGTVELDKLKPQDVVEFLPIGSLLPLIKHGLTDVELRVLHVIAGKKVVVQEVISEARAKQDKEASEDKRQGIPYAGFTVRGIPSWIFKAEWADLRNLSVVGEKKVKVPKIQVVPR